MNFIISWNCLSVMSYNVNILVVIIWTSVKYNISKLNFDAKQFGEVMNLHSYTDFPVYHTAFDSYEWMTNNGDPLFHRHVAG